MAFGRKAKGSALWVKNVLQVLQNRKGQVQPCNRYLRPWLGLVGFKPVGSPACYGKVIQRARACLVKR